MPWPFSGRSTAILGRGLVESATLPHTRFAFKLFHELAGSEAVSNIFFSPPSVMLCLALVHELASGETRESMAKVRVVMEQKFPKTDNRGLGGDWADWLRFQIIRRETEALLGVVLTQAARK